MKWIPEILFALLVFVPQERIEYFNRSELVQYPQLGNSTHHQQTFSEVFFIPIPNKKFLSEIKISLTLMTKKVMGVGNLTPIKSGVIKLSNIDNYITGMVDSTPAKGRAVNIGRGYRKWIADVPASTLINSPPEYTKEVGSGSVIDIDDIKVHIIDGKPHMKLTVNADSFYDHSSNLFLFVSMIAYKHNIQGQVLFLN